MKHDIFEFTVANMTPGQRIWRVIFLLACVAVASLDLFVWRP